MILPQAPTVDQDLIALVKDNRKKAMVRVEAAVEVIDQFQAAIQGWEVLVRDLQHRLSVSETGKQHAEREAAATKAKLEEIKDNEKGVNVHNVES